MLGVAVRTAWVLTGIAIEGEARPSTTQGSAWLLLLTKECTNGYARLSADRHACKVWCMRSKPHGACCPDCGPPQLLAVFA